MILSAIFVSAYAQRQMHVIKSFDNYFPCFPEGFLDYLIVIHGGSSRPILYHALLKLGRVELCCIITYRILLQKPYTSPLLDMTEIKSL